MQRFYKTHAGAALLVGNGNNLHLTPPAWFDYPSFGMNTIHLYEGWSPNFYTAVDNRVMREFGRTIAEKYRVIPKFIPTGLQEWQGENFVVFNHLADDLKRGWKPERLPGITYHNCMHVAMQIAYWMGFTTLLMIGVKHEHAKGNEHFWGTDSGMPNLPPVEDWFNGYKVLVDGMAARGVRVINISAETCLPEEIIPRGNWQDWRNT